MDNDRVSEELAKINHTLRDIKRIIEKNNESKLEIALVRIKCFLFGRTETYKFGADFTHTVHYPNVLIRIYERLKR